MPENQFLEALELRYKAKVEEARATIKLYLRNPQAVADHSSFVDELDKWVTVLAESESRLKALRAQLPQQSESDHAYVVTVSSDVMGNVEYED